MKHLTWYIVLSFLAVSSAAAETSAPSADDWYKNHYAPLYAENPWEKIDQFAKVFDADFHYHTSDGAAEKTNGATWIEEGITEWKAEDWLSSELASYESDLLNETTAAFKVKWLDSYADGSTVFECGWYLADRKNNNWVFTQYADIDCAEHGL